MRAYVPRQRSAKQRGFSLLELGIVIGVISVLTVGVLMARGFREAAQVSNTVRQILDIQKAAYQYSYRYMQGLNYAGINNAELLASGGAVYNLNHPLYDAPLQTAWGGAVTLQVDPADNTYFNLRIMVPDINIKNDLRSSIVGVGQDISPNDSFTVLLKLRGRPEGM